MGDSDVQDRHKSRASGWGESLLTGLAEALPEGTAMLPSSTFAVFELARQRQDELARETRKGHIRFASGRRRRNRGPDR